MVVVGHKDPEPHIRICDTNTTSRNASAKQLIREINLCL